jgi:hypothetical protein
MEPLFEGGLLLGLALLISTNNQQHNSATQLSRKEKLSHLSDLHQTSRFVGVLELKGENREYIKEGTYGISSS